MSDTQNGDPAAADIDDDKDDGSGASGQRKTSGTAYPYFNLSDAIDFARAVRDRGGNEVREDDLLSALKLSRTTKSWIYKLSSGREFGLVKRAGRKTEAKIIVTDLAKKLLLPGDEAETQAAKLAAFMVPPLYQKLYARYAGAIVPPVDRLANVLHRDYDLLESVANAAAEAFVESAKFAGLVAPSGHIIANIPNGKEFAGTANSVADRSSDPPPVVPAAPLTATPSSQRSPAIPTPPRDDFAVYGFQLRKDLRVDLALPINLTQKDVTRLHRWLETLPVDDEPPPKEKPQGDKPAT